MVTRQVKISLKQFTPAWDNSWIICRAMTFKESIDFDKEVSKAQYDLQRASRKLDAIKRELEVVETDEKLTEESRYIKQIENYSNKIFDKIFDSVEKSFISGSIFDEVQRDMKKEDIKMFDKEVYQYIIKHIKGDVEKK